MKSWSDGDVRTNGIRVHYYRTGGDKPQVVLSHGAMDDGLCWARVARALEEKYDVIMFDTRGHGLSDSGQGDYSSNSRAADIIEAIEILGLDKPVVGGHSMGADTSMHVAAQRSDLISGIFMEDPPVTMPGESLFLLEKGKDMGKMIINMMRVFKVFPKVITRPLAKKMMPASPNDEITQWLNSKKRVSRDFLRSIKSPTGMLNDAPFDVLNKINTPAVLIMGDRESGAIVSEESAREMSKALPGLEIARLKGASHDIRRVKFDEYIAVLENFIKRLHG